MYISFFPNKIPVALKTIVPDAPDEAVDLFIQFVKYDSAKRISAKEALKHRYFSIPPLAASWDKMPKPREKCSFAQKNQQEIQHEVSMKVTPFSKSEQQRNQY